MTIFGSLPALHSRETNGNECAPDTWRSVARLIWKTQACHECGGVPLLPAAKAEPRVYPQGPSRASGPGSGPGLTL
eukprot:gene10204-biopygen13830